MTKKINIILGKNIKDLRTKNNYLQKEISQYLQVAASTYSQYENSKSRPDYETLIKLAKLYNVSIDFILGYKVNEKNTNKKINITNLSPGIELHYLNDKKVTDEKLEIIKSIIDLETITKE
jgi:transcriptional regulator with XRE-family HTH domain